MCDSNFRRALLEHRFRVWLGGSVSDYDVTLTPISVILKPVAKASGGMMGGLWKNDPNAVCCRLCSRPAKVEVFGRDLLACRPAHGMPADTKVRKYVGKFRSLATLDKQVSI
jgi:hypothetical protein